VISLPWRTILWYADGHAYQLTCRDFLRFPWHGHCGIRLREAYNISPESKEAGLAQAGPIRPTRLRDVWPFRRS